MAGAFTHLKFREHSRHELGMPNCTPLRCHQIPRLELWRLVWPNASLDCGSDL